MAKLKYYGHSCWEFKQDDTSLLFDPYLSESPWTKGIPADLHPTLILLTHGHFDHLGDALEIARRSGAPILASYELANYVQEEGLQAIDGGFGGVDTFDWGWVKFVPAWHSSSWTPPGQSLRSNIPNGFVVKFFDHTYYEAGDTCAFLDMKLIAELTPIDVALLPIGGHYTMGVQEAVKAVEFVGPKVALPMHYSTWQPIEADPEEVKRLVESQTKSKVVVLRPGAEWDVPESL